MAQLGAGLHHMHDECRFIHRDIKPDNLLLTEDGAGFTWDSSNGEWVTPLASIRREGGQLVLDVVPAVQRAVAGGCPG